LKLQEVYLIRLGQTDLHKIGVSKNSKKRVKQLQTGCPYTLSLVHVHETSRPYKVETILHHGISSKKYSPTFLDDFDSLEGEWFNLTTQDVLAFKENCANIEKTLNMLKEAGNPFV
jgi:hypothetical protein